MEGNPDLGNEVDGAFVYTGMRVGWVMLKAVGSGAWVIFDSTRSPNNLNNKRLYPTQTSAETVGTGIDLLSNGFKLRSDDGGINYPGNQFVYAAFSENPFGASNTSPANAR